MASNAFLDRLYQAGGLKGLAPIANAPTYNDPFFDFNGQTYQNAFATDPALAMTLAAGGQGMINQGVGAFLIPNAATRFNSAGQNSYGLGDLQGLGKGLGIDTSAYSDATGLEQYLNSQLKDYIGISGLSGGWNQTGDPRQANNTVYKRENGKLVPMNTAGYSAPTQGSWLQENPEFINGIAPALAGLGQIAAGASAAGTAGGAGASAGAGAGGAGAGAAGAAGAGAQGWGSALANYLGMGSSFSSLPGYAQAALNGALQGGVTSGLSGGNPLQGALTGAVGGASGYGGGALASGIDPALAGLGSSLGSMFGRTALTGQAPGLSSLFNVGKAGVQAYNNGGFGNWGAQ